mmetsp:Transcript_19026/g.55339  ORF Transcript_19026/g.55339 Transcript_19026/m.55339 type:complete len:217 (+) Transcript_19026:587-1237(+)
MPHRAARLVAAAFFMVFHSRASRLHSTWVSSTLARPVVVLPDILFPPTIPSPATGSALVPKRPGSSLRFLCNGLCCLRHPRVAHLPHPRRPPGLPPGLRPRAEAGQLVHDHLFPPIFCPRLRASPLRAPAPVHAPSRDLAPDLAGGAPPQRRRSLAHGVLRVWGASRRRWCRIGELQDGHECWCSLGVLPHAGSGVRRPGRHPSTPQLLGRGSAPI